MGIIQPIKMDEPVPSLELYKLEWDNDNKRWIYVYSVDTPVELTEKPLEQPLYFAGVFTKTLINNSTKYMINIPVSTIDDVYRLYNRQRESDLLFRKRFEEEHSDFIKQFPAKTFTVKNETQNAIGKMVVSIAKMDEEYTTFVGRSGVKNG